MRIPTWVKTGAAVAGAATVGSIATAPESTWYDSLNKPGWQPPPVAFPLVWTPLYALIAFGSARALDRSNPADRAALKHSLALNLALNAGWTAVFFRGHRPRAALVEIAVLNASNLALLRRAWAADRTAGVALAPYVAWTGFATVLTAAIARRNPKAG